jgi:uncharacterized membrane protein
MSEGFFGLALAFSALMLLVGLFNISATQPSVLLFWLLIAAVSAYKLFRSSAHAS